MVKILYELGIVKQIAYTSKISTTDISTTDISTTDISTTDIIKRIKSRTNL